MLVVTKNTVKMSKNTVKMGKNESMCMCVTWYGDAESTHSKDEIKQTKCRQACNSKLIRGLSAEQILDGTLL